MSRFTLAAVALTLTIGCGITRQPDAMRSPAPLPTEPRPSAVVLDGSLGAAPQKGLVDLRQVPWRSATVSDAGRTVLLRFVPPDLPGGACVQLAHVNLSVRPTEIVATIVVGRPASTPAPSSSCLAPSRDSFTGLRLAAPLGMRMLRDGTDPTSQRPVTGDRGRSS